MLVRVVLELTSHKGHLTRLFRAVGDLVEAARVNDELKVALQTTVIDSMRFEQLHNEIVGTLTGSMVAASKDKGLRSALLGVITESLKDEAFMSQMLRAMTDATISAAQNKELRESILLVVKSAITDVLKDEEYVSRITKAMTGAGIQVIGDRQIREDMIEVTKIAITDALKDESFLAILRETLANSLKDGRIYRGAAAGVMGALNPFGRGARRDEASPRSLSNEDTPDSAASSPARSAGRSSAAALSPSESDGDA